MTRSRGAGVAAALVALCWALAVPAWAGPPDLNLTEFAAVVSNEQQSGNSSLGGQVLNPFDLSADPGGSSSGSGVAAAAGLAALTIGSDSEGSIISPATSNGVVGIRPTTGLLAIDLARTSFELPVVGGRRALRAAGVGS